MADIVITFSDNNEFIEFLKKLEDNTLGMDFHEEKELNSGLFPYGYNNEIHHWLEDVKSWREGWLNETTDEGEPAYTDEDGWNEEVATSMLENLINTYLVPNLQSLANNNLNEEKASQLTNRQWDAIASVAWNIGVPGVLGLFEIINNSENITQDGSVWIKSKTETDVPNPKYKKYLEIRRECEAAWWSGEEPEYRSVDDFITDEEASQQTQENSASSPNTTPEAGNGNTDETTQSDSYLYAHMSYMYIKNKNGGLHKTNLFASKLYYAQNINPEIPEALDYERINCSKALLYLHTIPLRYENIKNEKIKTFFNVSSPSGGRETIPYGMIVFLGGLIWRKRWYEANGEDPIRYGRYESADTYKRPVEAYDPLLITDTKGKLVFGVIDIASSDTYNVKYSEIVREQMDLYVENRLVYEFLSFVNGPFKEIMDSCELNYRLVTIQPEQATIGTGISYYTNMSDLTGITVSSTRKITFDDFILIESTVKSTNSLPYMLSVFLGSFHIPIPDSEDKMIVSNFKENYCMGFYNSEQGVMQTFFSENNIVHKYFTRLFNDYSVVLTVGLNTKKSSVSGYIYKKQYEQYLSGFVNTISYYAKKQTFANIQTANQAKSDKAVSRTDLNLALYMELKNIWDRWLCGYYNSEYESDRNYFNVMVETESNKFQNTMYGNFMFIDSFYVNISHKLKLNCNTLLDLYKGEMKNDREGGRNRVNVHLGNVASAHRCVMYNFPDYIGLSSSSWYDVNRTMESLFLPMPQSKIPLPNVMNKFVIIYANYATMVELRHENNFNTDTFNIYSYKDGTTIAPIVFKNSNANNLVTQPTCRMSYYVPSFCVEYSRQNNSYWTNIGVSMENNSNTAQAVLAYSVIAEKGNNSKRQVCFYGQDIYPVYQAYSYYVTIEMLGDAQIQPLMYFQLLNIPMFNGAYMVMSVEHEMSPGNMKTIIKGVKMSKVRVPYTKQWFQISEPGGMFDENSGTNDFANNTEDGKALKGTHGEYVDIADNTLEEAIKSCDGKHLDCDMFVKEVYGYEGIDVPIANKLNKRQDNMFNELSANIEDWVVEKLKVPATKKNKWKPLFTGDKHPKCGDLLFCMHDGIEIAPENAFHHVAIYLGHSGERSSKIFIAEGNSVGGSLFRDTPKYVQVCSIENSKMGYGTDIITHWASCKKYSVKQKSDILQEQADLRLVSSEVQQMSSDNANTSSNYTPNEFYSTGGKSYYVVENFLKHKEDVNVVEVDGVNIRDNLLKLLENVINPGVSRFIDTMAPIAHEGDVIKKPNINSGYRNKAYNEKIGGSSTSQHMFGEAADLSCQINSKRNRAYNVALAKSIVDMGVWDQLILEKVTSLTDIRCNFIHVSFKSAKRSGSNGVNRRQILLWDQNKYHTITIEKFYNLAATAIDTIYIE